jgi:hypothetical protein
MSIAAWRVQPLADEYVAVCESPDPGSISCYSPGLARLQNGRLIATTDFGSSDPNAFTGPLYQRKGTGRSWQGKVFTSDDRGRTWQHRHNFPFMHARPFVAGKSLYVLGQGSELMIIRSDDGGRSWSETIRLTDSPRWHQAPCNVHYANECVYLVMEHRREDDVTTWPVSLNAPILMRANVQDDLTKRESWTFATEIAFRDTVPQDELDWFGVPFYDCPPPRGHTPSPGRNCAPLGWLETNVIQFVDPDHYWHDPEGKTYHLWMRAHTGGTGYACVAKVIEQGKEPGTGDMITMLETVPSGKKAVYVPCPGGQMKFHVLYDEVTKLYWLLSTQARDSMTRAELLPADRYNLPNNERRRLQLHFSRNMLDWCFAGLVAVGPAEVGSRNYASMIINEKDLHILSRSGDENASNAHDVNMITFHTVRDFRRLVY